ncbi:MAG: ABC transporter permease subunit [Treponema sp.]|jgi:ABC-2 type transport system permease protein|nr:ABC transporter permease subunit [Treponema sp.]
MKAIIKKELYSALHSPVFYGVTVFFLVFTSVWLFYLQRYFTLDSATLRPFFAAFPLAMILAAPALTMKGWAEERKLGSVELLLTMPASEWELVLGKFLAAFSLLCIILALTIPVPLTLSTLGSFDMGVIVGEYIGAVLLSASVVSLGLLLSALSKNQASAFLGSTVVLVVVMLINQAAARLSTPLADFINFFSLSFHFEAFSKGIIDTRDAAFFILTTILFLFLNVRVILYRKWS